MSGMDQLAQSQLLVAQAMSGLADDMTGFGGGQLPGTTTNDNATAGNVGEYLENTGGVILVAPATPTDLAQLDLTAGDWEVSSTLYFNTSDNGEVQAGITTTSATLVLTRPNYAIFPINSTFNGNYSVTIGPLRRSLSATTTYYLVGNTVGLVGLLSSQGFLRAWRVR
jgi:hypothetical protein